MDTHTFLFALINNGEKERTGYIFFHKIMRRMRCDTSHLCFFEDRYLQARTTDYALTHIINTNAHLRSVTAGQIKLDGHRLGRGVTASSQ